MPVYHENNIIDHQTHSKYSPDNGYGANLSDSVPNLSLNMCGLRKQSISHGDLVHGSRYIGRCESIDYGVQRAPSVARNKSIVTKPPIHEKFYRNGPSMLLLEEREMPITRDRNAKSVHTNGHITNEANKIYRNGSPSMQHVNGNHHVKYSSDWLRIRWIDRRFPIFSILFDYYFYFMKCF